MYKETTWRNRVFHVVLALLVGFMFSVPTGFGNVFAEEETVDVTVTKKLEGADIKDYDGKFSFTLTATKPEGGTQTVTAKNDANGKVTFKVPKTLVTNGATFTVTEDEGYDPDIEYDTSEKTLTVTEKVEQVPVSTGTGDDPAIKNNVEAGKSQAEQMLVQYSGNGEDVRYDHGKTLANYVSYKTITDGSGNSYHPFCMVHYKSSNSNDFPNRKRFNEANGQQFFENVLTMYSYDYNKSVNVRGGAYTHKDKYKLAVKRALWLGYPYNTKGYFSNNEEAYQVTQCVIFALGQYGGNNEGHGTNKGVGFWAEKSGNKEKFYKVYDEAKAAGDGWAPTDVDLYIHWWNESGQPLLSAYHKPIEGQKTEERRSLQVSTATFTNKYVGTPEEEKPEAEPANAQIKIKKVLEGADIAKYNKAFTFELYAADDNGNILATQPAGFPKTATNDKKGNVIFEEINYDDEVKNLQKGDTLTKKYVVKEVIPHDDEKRANIQYYDGDGVVVTVTITVDSVTTTKVVESGSSSGTPVTGHVPGVDTNLEQGNGDKVMMVNTTYAGNGETVTYDHGSSFGTGTYTTWKTITRDGYHPFCMVHYKTSSSKDYPNRARFNEANGQQFFENVLVMYSYDYNKSVNVRDGAFNHKDKYKLAVKRAMWLGYPYNAKNYASQYGLSKENMYRVTQCVIFALGQYGGNNQGHGTNKAVGYWAGKSGNADAFYKIYDEARAAGAGWAPTPGVDLYIHWWNETGQPLLSANYAYTPPTPGSTQEVVEVTENFAKAEVTGDVPTITNKYVDEETPSVGTTASSQQDSENHLIEILDDGSAVIYDTVHCSNVLVGKEYTVKGRLINRFNYINNKGDYVLTTAEKKFKPEEIKTDAEAGTRVDVDVVIEFNLTADQVKAMAQCRAVAFEKLFEGNKEVAVHEDINDQKQTVYFPGIGTKAAYAGAADGKTVQTTDGVITITDVVSYTNLIKDRTYTLRGQLMLVKAAGGEPVKVADQNAEVTITGKDKGMAQVAFDIDIAAMVDAQNWQPGDKLVVYEQMYSDGKLVATHNDPTAESQTINIVKQKPVMGTTATVDGAHIALAEGPEGEWVTLVDRVEYSGLTAGEDYVIRAEIHDKSAPNDKTKFIKLMADTEGCENDNVHVHKTVTADADGKGYWDIEFKILKSQLIGKDVVVYERLFPGGTNSNFDTKWDEKEGDEYVNRVASHTDANDEGQTVHFPTVKTTAKDKVDGDHSVEPTSPARIIDTVAYTNLIVGETYTVKGVLMDKGTGLAVVDTDTGETVTAEATFVADAPEGTVDLEFIFNAKLFLETKDVAKADVVVYEELYWNVGTETKLVGEHKDLTDEDQTVSVETKQSIGTTATDETTGDHVAYADGSYEAPMETHKINGKTVINDSVRYEGLQAGQKYVIKGKLVIRNEDGTQGSIVKEASASFTASRSGKGTVVVTFEFDAKDLAGKDVVVFEALYEADGTTAVEYNNEPVVHEDINDEGQTVHFPEAQTTATWKPLGDESDVPGKACYDNQGNLITENIIPQEGFVTITDRVEYKNLIPGKTYEVSGNLVDTETKGVLVSAGETFTPESPDGYVDLTFTFNAASVAKRGKQVNLVAFERILLEGNVVAMHENLEDTKQMVTVEEWPEIEVKKVTNVTEVPVGMLIDYTITVTNKSQTATAKNVTVQDIMGVGLDFVECSDDGVHDGDRTTTWQVAELAPGETKEFTISCIVTEDATEGVVNRAAIPDEPITPQGGDDEPPGDEVTTKIKEEPPTDVTEDESPKTSDEAPVNMALFAFGASVLVMVAVEKMGRRARRRR